MSEIERILDQMDRAFSGDAWHGPSLTSLLDGISAEDASKHAVGGAHSIWELVHHLGAWNTIVGQRLQGRAEEVTAARDWPPVWDLDEAAWKRALDQLSESHARLRKVTRELGDQRLWEKAAGPDYTCYVVLHGVVQHNLYHAGQIAILKKALA
jgi:uncharacterized damage-inducible protein DinB